MKMMLLWLLIVLQVVDALTTIKILEKGGRELNPAMDWIFRKIGVLEGLFIVKTLICGMCWIWMEFIPVWAFLFLIGATSLVIHHNIKQLQK